MADQELTGLSVKIKADMSDYAAKMQLMESTTARAVSRVSSALAIGGASIGAFAMTAINAAATWGKAVDDLADKTGMAGEEASKFLVIAKRTGIDGETANQMFAKFGKSIYTAADAMAKAAKEGKASDDVLTKLGVTAVNSNGSVRGTLEIFTDVKNALNAMEDGWQKTAFEMQLFGRSGAAMHDMLSMTDEEMTKVIAKAQAMGLILSTEQAQAWEQFDRNINSAKGTLAGLGIGISNELLPKLMQIVDTANNAAAAFLKWKDQAGPTARNLADVAESLLLIAAAIKAIGMAGLKVPAWLIPIIGAGYMGTQIAQSEAARGAAENAAGMYGVTLPGAVPNITTFEDDEVRNWPGSKSPGSNAFVGGTGGGGSSKTAWQEWIAQFNKRMQLAEVQAAGMPTALGQPKLRDFLTAGIAELNKIQVTEDEIIDKELEREKLTKAIKDSVTKEREEQEKVRDILEDIDELRAKQEMAMGARRAEQDMQREFALINAQQTSPSGRAAVLWDKLQSASRQEMEMLSSPAGVYTNEQMGAIRAQVEGYRQAWLTANNDIAVNAIEANRRVQDSYADMLVGLATGTRSAHDILKNLWTQYVDYIIRKMMGIGQQNGNLWAQILGGGFNYYMGGNGSVPGDGSSGTYSFGDGMGSGGGLDGFAEGGSVRANVPILVGEKRPEIFVPRQNGVILPDAQAALAGGGGTSYQVSINPVFQSLDPATGQAIFDAQMPRIIRNMEEAIQNNPSTVRAVRKVSMG